MSTTTTTVVTTDDDPQAAPGGLGPEQNRIIEGDLQDAIQNSNEIVPLDATKGVLVVARATGGQNGSLVKVGSWSGHTQFAAFAPADKSVTACGEFAAGESYWVEVTDGGSLTTLFERTR